MLIDPSIENVTIISDEGRLKQIILNLVANAYKFTKSGFIKIRVDYVNEFNTVEISVEDTGLGINEQDYHLIFQEQTQLNSEKEYTSKGSGLGLSIIKNLAEALRHKIGFQSKYGFGSKFYLSIECSCNIKKH